MHLDFQSIVNILALAHAALHVIKKIVDRINKVVDAVDSQVNESGDVK